MISLKPPAAKCFHQLVFCICVVHKVYQRGGNDMRQMADCSGDADRAPGSPRTMGIAFREATKLLVCLHLFFPGTFAEGVRI